MPLRDAYFSHVSNEKQCFIAYHDASRFKALSTEGGLGLNTFSHEMHVINSSGESIFDSKKQTAYAGKQTYACMETRLIIS